MPIYSSSLFDFYSSGDTVKVCFRGTSSDVGYTPYAMLTNSVAQYGNTVKLNIKAIVSTIIERWLEVESYIITNGLPINRPVVKAICEKLFWPSKKAKEIVKPAPIVEEDDHMEFEYEYPTD